MKANFSWQRAIVLAMLVAVFCPGVARPDEDNLEDNLEAQLRERCIASLRSDVPSASQFQPITALFGPPTTDSDRWERLSLSQLSHYLSGVLPPDDRERLSLTNAQLMLEGLPQSYGGTIFSRLEVAQAYIAGLIAKYGPAAKVVPKAQMQWIRPIDVCYDSLYGSLKVRAEGVCWLVRQKGGDEAIVDWGMLPAPDADCALRP